MPAKTLPSLVDWTLTEAKLGQARLHRHGKDTDPVLVLIGRRRTRPPASSGRRSTMTRSLASRETGRAQFSMTTFMNLAAFHDVRPASNKLRGCFGRPGSFDQAY
ncbi:hypothetical protein [Streptomyces olivaceoviridis]